MGRIDQFGAGVAVAGEDRDSRSRRTDNRLPRGRSGLGSETVAD
jgi:hypothetical protein